MLSTLTGVRRSWKLRIGAFSGVLEVLGGVDFCRTLRNEVGRVDWLTVDKSQETFGVERVSRNRKQVLWPLVLVDELLWTE